MTIQDMPFSIFSISTLSQCGPEWIEFSSDIFHGTVNVVRLRLDILNTYDLSDIRDKMSSWFICLYIRPITVLVNQLEC